MINDTSITSSGQTAQSIPKTKAPLSRADLKALIQEAESAKAAADSLARIKSLLSRADVAELLGTCPHTVARLTRRGLLPAFHFNSRLIRYSPEAVAKYIESARVGDYAPSKEEVSR